MTPKEKAKELLDKFTFDLRPFSEFGEWDTELAKQCSLIAVDEIRDVIPQISDIQYYWIDVKAEIQKL
jgi:hypothetical protein